MKIKTWIKYDVAFLPTPRCRKYRYREEEDHVEIELKEVTMNELKKAFKVDEKMIYSYGNKLWTKASEKSIHCVHGEETRTALEALIYARVTYSTYFGRYNGYHKDAVRENRDQVISRAKEDMEKYLLVDGELYEVTYEPMYNITTFGLGFNHGGTGFFVTYHYNPNISYKSYFNALQYEEAINYAIKTAAGRGDTKDVERYEKAKLNNDYKIIVYDKTLVTKNPRLEHGEGNPLLNDFEEAINASNNINEAGLLVTAITAAMINN
jgi:hypothetical protein